MASSSVLPCAPPGQWFSREDLLRHRVPQQSQCFANFGATDDPRCPSLVHPRSLFTCARRMRRHAAKERDHITFATLMAENKFLKEKVGTGEIAIQTDVAVDESPSSVPFDAAEFFRSKVQEIKKIAAEQAEEKFIGVLESQKLLQNSLEETVDFLKQKLSESQGVIESLRKQILDQKHETASLRTTLQENPRQLLLPDLDLSGASSQSELVDLLTSKLQELIAVNDDVGKQKMSFASENYCLCAEITRLKHDNVILRDELSELKQQFSDDGNFCDD